MKLLIVGYFNGERQVLDIATNWIEGYKLLVDYKLAYGPNWDIQLKCEVTK